MGAGPTGLMLAGELRLAGVRPLVLERQPQLRDTPKASGLGGQILQLLRYRGLLDRFEAASSRPPTRLPGPRSAVCIWTSHIWRIPRCRRCISRSRDSSGCSSERASELGADIRRGHEVVGVSQDDATVTADVRGPDGPYRVTARYLVGCDGARSRVRDMAGIAFPGTTYPEVNRLAQVTMPDSVTLLDNGDLDVPGLGRIRCGFHPDRPRRVRVRVARPTGSCSSHTTEDESAESRR